MPWSENRKMDTRFAAIKDFHTGNYSKKAICEIYGVSRPTLDKWINRFDVEGWKGIRASDASGRVTGVTEEGSSTPIIKRKRT